MFFVMSIRFNLSCQRRPIYCRASEGWHPGYSRCEARRAEAIQKKASILLDCFASYGCSQRQGFFWMPAFAGTTAVF